MDTLDGTSWDVLIVGTGLKQSLLALSLSRSTQKILHVDRNDYYGSSQAALSLSEAEAWASRYAAPLDETQPSRFTNATITHTESDASSVKLGQPRAYSLALAPELIFTRSNILPSLVSSKVHGQLEFQAVGSWFVLEEQGDTSRLAKVPNGREDIFQDAALDLRAKRSLMKFIRFITDPESQTTLTSEEQAQPIPDFLQQKFGIAKSVQAPLVALTLSDKSPDQITVGEALPNIVRHLQSIGLFGAGFNALTSKWGGLAEIAQVACRAGAVGGGVYVLDKSVENLDIQDGLELVAHFSDGDKVSTKWVVGSPDDLSLRYKSTVSGTWSRSISIVSSTLSTLFPPTSDGGVTPAGAVIRMTVAELPVYIFAHSADTGECPAGQCVLYASVACAGKQGHDLLQQGMNTFLSSFQDQPPMRLWTLTYEHHSLTSSSDGVTDRVLLLNDLHPGLALEDETLVDVRRTWHSITGEETDNFLKFDARTGTEEDSYDEMI